MVVDESHHKTEVRQRISNLYHLYYIVRLSLLDYLFPTARLYSYIKDNRSMKYVYMNSKHGLAKLFGVVVTALVAFVSYSVSNDSPWYTESLWKLCDVAQVAKKNMVLNITLQAPLHLTIEPISCPPIRLERYLVVSSSFILIMASICLICCCFADHDTVNTLKNKDAFLHVFFGVIIFVGGVCFIVSAAKISKNKCSLKDAQDHDIKEGATQQLCSQYFMTWGKYFAGGFAVAVGIYYMIIVACVLENVKLFGMNAHPNPASATVRDSVATVENGGVPPRQSVFHSRRASVTSQSRVKKGVGSFGAVTSNISHKNVRQPGDPEHGVTFSDPTMSHHH